MNDFREDVSGTNCQAHPAQIVPHYLASSCQEDNKIRLDQLDNWYMGYQQKRGSTVVYKSMSSFVRCSTALV